MFTFVFIAHYQDVIGFVSGMNSLAPFPPCIGLSLNCVRIVTRVLNNHLLSSERRSSLRRLWNNTFTDVVEFNEGLTQIGGG